MFAIFAVLIGVVVAIQSRINGQLSVDLDNGLAAALVSFLTGLTLVTVLVFGFKREREALFRIFVAVKNKELLAWEVMGGVLGGSLLLPRALLFRKSVLHFLQLA